MRLTLDTRTQTGIRIRLQSPQKVTHPALLQGDPPKGTFAFPLATISIVCGFAHSRGNCEFQMEPLDHSTAFEPSANNPVLCAGMISPRHAVTSCITGMCVNTPIGLSIGVHTSPWHSDPRNLTRLNSSSLRANSCPNWYADRDARFVKASKTSPRLVTRPGELESDLQGVSIHPRQVERPLPNNHNWVGRDKLHDCW